MIPNINSYKNCNTSSDERNPPVENPTNYEQIAYPEDMEKNPYIGILYQKSRIIRIGSVEENMNAVQFQIDGQN